MNSPRTAAEQDITKPDLMELHQSQAKIEMQDKSIVNMSANSGSYDMKTEMLTLADEIDVVSSNGYEARLSEAAVDVHKGTIVSEKPVWVKAHRNGDRWPEIGSAATKAT